MSANNVSGFEGVVAVTRYGNCVLCGDRVRREHDFITAKEGYCHRTCLAEKV